jgi:hypothetical protein
MRAQPAAYPVQGPCPGAEWGGRQGACFAQQVVGRASCAALRADAVATGEQAPCRPALVGGPGRPGHERVSVCFDVVARACVLRECYTDRIMSDRVSSVAAKFRELSTEERIEMIRTLPASERRLIRDAIDGDDASADEVAHAWSEEVDRRVESILDGSAELIDEADVIAEAARRRAARRAG